MDAKLYSWSQEKKWTHKIKLAKAKTIWVSLLLSSRGLGSPTKKSWKHDPFLQFKKKKKYIHSILQIIREAHSLTHSMDYRSTEVYSSSSG